MHYHKSPKNRRVLALLLTGSLLFEEFPFMPASTAMLNYQPKTMVLI